MPNGIHLWIIITSTGDFGLVLISFGNYKIYILTV